MAASLDKLDYFSEGLFFACLFFCFYNLMVIGDPCVVALCECNERGGDRANEVSLSPEIVDTHHTLHRICSGLFLSN